MPDPDTIIDGRYRVLSRLGTGGTSDVFLAQDDQLGRLVALKVLHRRFAEDQEFVERFRREASSAAGLSHPHVVSVFDRGEWDGTYYIAMEYLSGRSLKTVVRDDGALEPDQAIEIVLEILAAARFAHQHGIIHRDLKPHNVILDEEGRARVTDFGIARAGASDMTQTGSIMGTAQYLSPEQAQGDAVTAASDLYTIGIVLYELLTGSLPFDGETAVTIALKQVSEPPPAPSSRNPAVSPALDAVVRRALAKSPHERFADADEFMAALEAARLHPHRAVAPPPPPAALLDGASAPGAAAMIAPLVADAPPPAGRRGRGWAILAALVLVAGAVGLVLALVSSAARVTVPALTRCVSQSDAAATLARRGLRAAAVSQASITCASGQVVSQSPSGGTKVARGTAVSIVVSSGPGTAFVPTVTGRARADARRELLRAGFRPEIQTRFATAVAPGSVISTDPSGGTEARLGSAVSVLVSSGPEPVSVPLMTGDTRAAATRALAAAGLRLGTVMTRPAAGAPAGLVLAQSPTGGTTVPAGGAVDITVAQRPGALRVPSEVGRPEGAAAAALGAAGFAVTTTARRVSQGSPDDGRVLSQAPPAGHPAKRGTTVTIVVGMGRPVASTVTTTTSSRAPSSTSTTTTTTTRSATTSTPP